uniref:Uncharacterized protein n=1 Tax=Rhizophora mucronata TaxID=61149 RepID=A0A2P2QMR2_RHIMU
MVQHFSVGKSHIGAGHHTSHHTEHQPTTFLLGSDTNLPLRVCAIEQTCTLPSFHGGARM